MPVTLVHTNTRLLSSKVTKLAILQEEIQLSIYDVGCLSEPELDQVRTSCVRARSSYFYSEIHWLISQSLLSLTFLLIEAVLEGTCLLIPYI